MAQPKRICGIETQIKLEQSSLPRSPLLNVKTRRRMALVICTVRADKIPNASKGEPKGTEKMDFNNNNDSALMLINQMIADIVHYRTNKVSLSRQLQKKLIFENNQ